MDDLERIFNHVVLPPKLPEEQDPDINSLEHALLQRLMDAAKVLHENTAFEFYDSWTVLRSCLQACRIINNETLDRLTLKVAFQTLSKEHDRVLICHVVEQNAALLIHRHIDADENDIVVFEAFEASPQSQDVLAAPNALLWEFPSKSAQIPIANFDDEDFQTALASFLDKASSEQLSHLAAKAKKVGVSLNEFRNPGSPAMITHMLLTILEAMGGPSDVEPLNKRVRDDVHLKKGSVPWRRLPFWLILRVAAQRQLKLVLGSVAGNAAYKVLISALLAKLMQDLVEGGADPALVVLLKKKLCRRLAKLQSLATQNYERVHQLLEDTKDFFRNFINNADAYIQEAFGSFKASIVRKVPLLPKRIDGNGGLRLSLPSSQAYLRNLQSLNRAATWSVSRSAVGIEVPGSLMDQSNDSGIRKMQRFGQQYLSVERHMENAKVIVASFWKNRILGNGQDAAVKSCFDMSAALDTLMSDASTMSEDNPEHCSAFLLSVFESWAAMDAAAVAACPILAHYSPVFSAELLDVLHLPSLENMKRLRNIQKYLRKRQKSSEYRNRTIFGPLDKDSFSASFVESSRELFQLLESIQSLEKKNRASKTRELKKACDEYDKLSAKVLSNTCRCTITQDGQRNVRGCARCYFWRTRKRMDISVCENLLPSIPSHANAVVFELAMPRFIATYRNTTWRVLTKFAYPIKPGTAGKVKRLSEHSDLTEFSKSHMSESTITLASPVKSVNQTHYKKQSMKVDIEKLLLPLASRFELYDSQSMTWISRYLRPLTLAHWCGIHVPPPIATSVLPKLVHPPTQPDGPSSYTVISNRPKCPPEMSAHEFEAYQRLLSGKERRWLTILVELGSSNLNFSSVDTMLMLSQLANQAGPASTTSDAESTSHDSTLGVCHAMFSDMSFVQRLIDEVGKRLNTIRGNWHEIHLMELLITLASRAYVLVNDDAKRLNALNLLLLARETTLEWIDVLQNEVTKAEEGSVAEKASMYAFKAALLCRRTMIIFCADNQKPIGPSDISSYVRASVALQQNLVVDLEKLDMIEKAMLQRDLAMATSLQDRICSAISSYPGIVSKSIAYNIGLCDKSILLEEGRGRMGADLKFTSWEYLQGLNKGWISSAMSGNSSSMSQRYDFHYTEGHLLVDGKPMGKLPQDIRDSEDVKELFPNQYLLTYASFVPGMTHRLRGQYDGCNVHVGMRDKRVVIVTTNAAGWQCEYVPRRVFVASSGIYDLPRNIVDNYVHWYNKYDRSVEFRRKGSIWFFRANDWRLDLRTQQLQRNKVLLVDPHCQICKRIASIFSHFEDHQRLTVFQPLARAGSLSVELRHLDLSFSVNARGLLHCRELDSEIDPNQDAGTLYGYLSMIVLRDIHDHSRRSIIAPLGSLRWNRTGPHISVYTDIGVPPRGRGYEAGNAQSVEKVYARFGIDTVLGRLTCPPELRLLYTKAKLHAFTSCPLADPLTGRTGEEEAVQTLISGRCQPWMPLPEPVLKMLKQIEALAPKRQYYPQDMRIIQQVTWDANIPTGLQHDRYGRIVRELIAKSENLAYFSETPAAGNVDGGTEGLAKEMDARIDHSNTLEMRGEIQRLRYESPYIDLAASLSMENNDMLYNSLGRMSGPFPNAEHKDAFNTSSVFQITRMLLDEADEISMTRPLSKILNGWTLIGGYDTALETDLVTLTTLMSTQTMGERWGSLVELCRSAPECERAEAMFTLATMAFSPGVDMDYLRLLAAYVYLPELKDPTPPFHASYDKFRFEEKPTMKTLEEIITSAYVAFKPEKLKSAGWNLVLADHEKNCAKHQAECQKEGKELARKILDQWPMYSEPSAMGFKSEKIDVSLALAGIIPEWKRLLRNKDLTDYVKTIQKALQPYNTSLKEGLHQNYGAAAEFTCGGLVAARRTVVPSLSGDLLRRNMPPLQHPFLKEEAGLDSVNAGVVVKPNNRPIKAQEFAEMLELGQIITSFSKSSSPLRQDYAKDLAKSMVALTRLETEKCNKKLPLRKSLPSELEIEGYIQYATSWCARALKHIRIYLSEGSAASDLLQRAELWPRLSPISILELLQSTADHEYGENVRETLVAYGCAVAALQRLHRIRRILNKKDPQRASDEWRNSGHENWNPAEQTDWLLFEIDSDLLIRAEQVEVARAIIAPASGKNSVLQLNMGKGKTSCIVPMAIAALANGKQLARLIVPKALLLPTAQMMQSRLGGLVGRELRHISFSRRLAASNNVDTVLKLFKEHHSDLMRRRGVLLAAPEHVLAFKLSGLQCLADGKNSTARDMIAFQQKLADEMCRDILDESDFTLAVRTQLVYPSGTLSAVDAAPHRWKLAQMLLALVEENLQRLCRQFGNSIRALERPGGGFPMVYILRMEIGEELNRCIVHDISSGRVPFFRPIPNNGRSKKMSRQQISVAPEESARLIRKALSRGAVEADVDKAAEMFGDTRAAADGLTLIRGLLVNNILLVCLRKRWNVQYGLHPQRWPIAVPFEAKGVPSERSEFGHPDVAILFTCLAFYYAGLNKTQFCEGLKHVLQHTDDPATEYERWTAGAVSLPEELQHWNIINADDMAQAMNLWNHLRFTRPVIDHYLNTFVFPRHSRQFSVKLQASAWDLPLFRNGAATTGFSGTNDNKMMLPLTIKQEDLPSLQQTNAEVLTYLLQPRSRRYMCTATGVRRWSEKELLQSLARQGIRVLIDAGAYILEKDNESLARAWLDLDTRIPAAVFFGTDNRAYVLFRDVTAKKMPLMATPFVDQLEKCLVYFDEAHTRGVDLLLPPTSRGALTLALGQTKDHTVQAAMRLRQLGTTQSVVFCAPPEVDESIREICRDRLDGSLRAAVDLGRIESPHVICWLLEQTCLANEQLHPLYLSHGHDFCRRASSQCRYGPKLVEDRARTGLLDVLQQPERQTVAQLYGIGKAATGVAVKSTQKLALPELEAFSVQLRSQRPQGSILNGVPGSAWQRQTQTTGAFEEVEQEREMEVQIEQVRAQQRRVDFDALKFPGKVHDNILTFVQTGILSGDQGYKSVFASIGQTEAGGRYGVKVHAPQATGLFVSDEFDRTIVAEGREGRDFLRQLEGREGREGGDDFLRPVEWVIWSPTTETALVVVPEELELLLPMIRGQSVVHLLTYAAAVTRSMAATFSGLQYYALPALPSDSRLPVWLPVELGILAGRLYMTFEEAAAMREYLGGGDDEAEKNTDEKREKEKEKKAFCADPAGFLLEWLSLRRVGQDIMHTPAAYICQGRPLWPDHAFFAGADGSYRRGSRLSTASAESGRASSADDAVFSDGGDAESASSESGEVKGAEGGGQEEDDYCEDFDEEELGFVSGDMD